MKITIFSSVLLLIGGNCLSRETDNSVLTLTEALEIVKNHHPIIRQAYLQDGFAEAELKAARGEFDPKLSADFNSKNLQGTEYYNKLSGSLKIPTWFPLDPKIEVYRNRGEYLNPENYISPSADYWQMTTGLSLPVGKGLFIDERRALVKQARLYGAQAKAEKIKLVNKTLFTVIKSYWDWYLAHREYQLMQQSIGIAKDLFERVKLDYGFGEAAVTDTIQAMITYQSRKIDFQQAELALTQAKLAFEVHLWGPNELPLELTESVVPTASEKFGIVPANSGINTLILWSVENHPDILKLSARKDQYEVEKRWNRESLKPEINLSYSLINTPMGAGGFQTIEWDDNYKLSADFYFPLFLRKERGKLQKTKLYMESLEYDLRQIRQELSAEIKSTFAQLKTNETLLAEYRTIAEGYEKLLDAELVNLQSGESDLFKLNIQQDKYIESQVKYLNALIKYEKLKAALPYIVGLPGLSYQKMYD